MPATTGAFSHLLAPGVRNTFFMYKKDAPTEYEKIFLVDKSNKNYEENLEIAALGVMPQKQQGSPILYQEMIQGGIKKFIHATYGLGFRATEEVMEDDLYGVIKKNAKALKRSALVAREVVSFGVLNRAFTTEYGFPKNGVNEALISTAHTLLGGGTGANRPSTDLDISQAALEAALIAFNLYVDDRSMPIEVEPKYILTHPSQQFLVQELLTSDHRPYTANNEVNVLKGMLTAMTSRYLDDADAWFVLSDKNEDGLVFFERRALTLQNGDDFDTGDAKFKATQRFSAGCSEWRNLYGSTGV
jgi:phage major head subunit gpT-like protein